MAICAALIGSRARILMATTAICWALAHATMIAAEEVSDTTKSESSLRVVEGRVYGELIDTTLVDAIVELGQEAGFGVKGSAVLGDTRTTRELSGVPVLEALRQLLAGYSHVVEVGSNEQITRLWILRAGPQAPPPEVPELSGGSDSGGSDEVKVPTVAAAPPGHDTPPEKIPDELAIADERQPPPPELEEIFYPTDLEGAPPGAVPPGAAEATPFPFAVEEQPTEEEIRALHGEIIETDQFPGEAPMEAPNPQ